MPRRRQKYLRALRHILVASLMMASFYVGRWTMNWRLVDLFATVAYIVTVLLYFRLELREHRRDSQAFREFLRQCEGHLSDRGYDDARRAFQKMADNAAEALDALNKDSRAEILTGGKNLTTDVDATDKAFGYRSFKCPKCGRESHIPAEVKPYCIECLFEFKSAEWRG